VNHGYLAVDFFFVLSGFVMAYAYDDRWGTRMTMAGFFRRRLIRLHPMVVFGAVLGLLAFIVQGCTRWDGSPNSLWTVVGAFVLALVMLPVLPGSRFDVRGNNEMFPLNGPSWSLFFEYIANVLYAVILHKLRTRWLLGVVVASGIGLALFAFGNLSEYGHLGMGWTAMGWHFPGGLLRVLFSYSAGMLLARMFRNRQPSWVFRHIVKARRGMFAICSIVIIVLLAMPRLGGEHHFWMNELYEVVCIILVFPTIVTLAAAASGTGRESAAEKWLGDISYPVYIVHYPYMYLFYYGVWSGKITETQMAPAMMIVIALSLLTAWFALKFYDEPLRKKLNAHQR